MSIKHFEPFFQKLDSQLLRAKGYLSIAESKVVYLMQYAAKRMTWKPGSYAGPQYVVFIGIDLDVKRLTKEWNQLTNK
jgi:G3E family GTPase